MFVSVLRSLVRYPVRSFALAASLAGCSQGEVAPQGPLVELKGLDGGFEKAPVLREGTGVVTLNEDTTAPAGPTVDAPLTPASEAQTPSRPEPGPEPGNAAERVDGVPQAESAVPLAATTPSSARIPAVGHAIETLDPALPWVVATRIASIVYKQPHTVATRIGYVRLGGALRRDAVPVKGSGCKGDWYAVQPHGFVCTDDATTNIEDPLVRATRRRPDLSKALPYPYGFVRATAPQYLKVPSAEQQRKSEFKLDEHMDWYREHYAEVQRVVLGANDVPLDERGFALLGQERKGERLSTQLTTTELLGGTGEEGEVPFWLVEGRTVPNVSGYEVPEYALFADRVRRKTGLSFVDAFVARDGDLARRFAVTVDLRLVPGTKVKPDTGSSFHGVPITDGFPLPSAFVNTRGATTWKLLKGRDDATAVEPLPLRALVPLSGNARVKAGRRFYQLARDKTRWLQASDAAVFDVAPTFPKAAQDGKKWIDISLLQQTLVLYEGKKPVYATLVSTGKDRLGDPEKTMATPQGEFTIQSKHIAAAMDSEENSTVSGGTKARKTSYAGDAQATIERLLAAEKAGKSLDDEDQRRLANVKKGRHPEYGVTMRRGSGGFELRDVPWIQYFAAGYALHGAYWHDVFGTPRSHGCVNLAPIDARYVFFWTDPPVPDGWHGLNTGDAFGAGTTVVVRE